jgi:hypothetical protein
LVGSEISRVRVSGSVLFRFKIGSDLSFFSIQRPIYYGYRLRYHCCYPRTSKGVDQRVELYISVKNIEILVMDLPDPRGREREKGEANHL